MILTENEFFAQFVLLLGSKIYFFWQKYTSQTKYFFGSLINRSPCVYIKIFQHYYPIHVAGSHQGFSKNVIPLPALSVDMSTSTPASSMSLKQASCATQRGLKD